MYVKEKETIKSRAELQNLISSLILRQTDEFTLDDIIQNANLRLSGSSYYESEELKERCSDTLRRLLLMGNISITPSRKYVISTPLPAVSTR